MNWFLEIFVVIPAAAEMTALHGVPLLACPAVLSEEHC